ncbi:hypothetical protein OH687_07825 [Burkholderia anthina]|nr:hypothetical protein OH687_07825 [Burkholderia anthina]
MRPAAIRFPGKGTDGRQYKRRLGAARAGLRRGATAAPPACRYRVTRRPPGKPEDAGNVSTCRERGALWNQCVRFRRDGTAKAGLAAWGSGANASHL